MRKRTIMAASAAAALMSSSWCAAQQRGEQAQPQQPEIKPLAIGDDAPEFDIAHWIKLREGAEGQFEPMTEFEDGKVYVLEFWATWCGPCRAGMPHISELQEKYTDYDVQIIGVSNEPLPTVANFLFQEDRNDSEMNWNRMAYTVATDPDQSVWNDYFRAAGQRGIPNAFIIDKEGKVAWIGHPMSMDEALDDIVHDRWDRAAFKQQFEQGRQAQETAQRSSRELATALQNEDWDRVVELLDAQIEGASGQMKQAMRLQKFQVLLSADGRTMQAYELGQKLMEESWDDPMILNQIAWFVVDPDNTNVTRRNLNFAQKAAERATELTDDQNAAILDTVARVYHSQGDLQQAIEWQKKAVEHLSDAEEGSTMGQQVKETLKSYQQEAGQAE